MYKAKFLLSLLLITGLLKTSAQKVNHKDTTIKKVEAKLLLGYPTGLGLNTYFLHQKNYRAGIFAQGGISFFEGLVKQADAGIILESLHKGKKGFQFSTSLGIQYWNGSDGVWYAVRPEVAWNKTSAKNNKISFGYSIVPLFFYKPEFFIEGNIYFQLRYKLF